MSEAPVTLDAIEQRSSERPRVRPADGFAKVKGAQRRECVVPDESKSGARLAIDERDMALEAANRG